MDNDSKLNDKKKYSVIGGLEFPKKIAGSLRRKRPQNEVIKKCSRIASERNLSLGSEIDAYSPSGNFSLLEGKKSKQFNRIYGSIERKDLILEYPDAPSPVNFDALKVPDKPGIYFVWNGGRIVYVGQSARLSRRVNRFHEKIFSGDAVSFLLFKNDVLMFAECFYIGMYRPNRNSITPCLHQETTIDSEIIDRQKYIFEL